MRGLILLLLLLPGGTATLARWGCSAAAGEEPVPHDELALGAAAASAAVRAVEARDEAALQSLASSDEVDPWVVVDELERLGRMDVARALGEATQPRDEGLEILKYVQRREASGDDGALRARWERIHAEGELDADLSTLLAALPAPEAPAERISLLLVRWTALLAEVAVDADPASDVALALSERAVRFAWHVGWARLELEGAVTLVRSRRARGEHKLAAQDLLNVEALWEKRGGWQAAAEGLFQRGLLSQEADDRAAAYDYFRRAELAFRRAGDARGEAIAASNQGLLDAATGNLVRALERHETALALLKHEEDQDAQLEVKGRVAVIHELVGALEAAQGLQQTVADARRDVAPADPWAEGIARANLARVLYLRGEVEPAILAARQAEDLLRADGRPVHALEALANRAWFAADAAPTHGLVEELKAGLTSAGAAVELRIHLGCALGRVLLRQGQVQAALGVLQDAAGLLGDVLVDLSLQADVRAQVGIACLAAGWPQEGFRWIDEFVARAIGKVDGLEAASSKTLRGRLAREALDAGVRAARDAGDLERAWRYVEASRSLRLLASLGGRESIDMAVLPPGLREELDRARAALRQAIADVARETQQRPPRHDAIKRSVAAREAAEEHRDRLAERVRAARQELDLQDLSGAVDLVPAARLQRSLSDSDAVVALSLPPDGDSVLALVVGPREITAHDLEGRTELLDAVRRLRRAGLTSRANPEPEAGGDESPPRTPAQVLDAVRTRLSALRLPEGVRTLFLVPDGALAYLPYVAVWPNLNVVLLPSASLVGKARSASRRAGTKHLAVAISDYSGQALTSDLARADRALGIERAGSGGYVLRLRPLPHATSEAEGVRAAGGIALIGPEATSSRLEDLLLDASSPTWATVHFAVHGIVNADHPTLSGLALADGLYTAQEVFSLRLRTDMVVLSACDTATDPDVLGEGMAGLVRSFLHARAPRVIASLWQVPDEPTSVLMRRFYELLASQREMPVAEALRRAQEHVRTVRDGTWAAPQNWAAWTLWGAP